MTLALFLGAMSAASAADRFYIDAVNIEPGETKTLAFILDNEQEFYGFQADITLPDGLEIVTNNGKPDITLSSRADASYTIVSNMLANENVRLGTFSTSHTPLTGNYGALLYVKVKADSDFIGGTLAITNVIFIGANDRDVELPDFTIQLGTSHNDSFYIPDFKIAVGETKTIGVILDNETPFTAFQTDIYLPEGLTIVANSFKLTSRKGTGSHSISSKSFSDGRTRVACFATNNVTFTGNTGALLEFEITANKDVAESCTIELKNQLFSMSNGKEYVLPNSITAVTTERALVTSILLDYNAFTLTAGETLQINANVQPTFASTKDVEWSSSNPAIASVTSTGFVTAIAPGNAVITCSAVDGSGVSATCNLTVQGIPVSKIILSRTSASLKATETVTLVATVSPANASDKTIVWSSSNSEIASVDANGVVTAVAVGNATIYAASSSTPNVKAQCSITVVPTPVSSIVLSSNALSLQVGETAKLSAEISPETATNKDISWSSVNSSIATVDADGNINALSLGSTQIKASATDGSGVTSLCQVTVVPTPAGSITINTPERTEFKVGETIALSATVLPQNATDKTVTWSSSNSSIVRISADGIATAIKEGQVTITAYDSANHSAEISITVIHTLAESITVSPETVTLQVGAQATIAYNILPSTTTNKDVEWTIDNPAIASVQNGVIVAKSIGTTNVKVKTLDGSNLIASTSIIVVPTPAESISISYNGPKTLYVGQTAQLTATVMPETATDKSVSWLSQSGAVSVDENGLVTAVALGTARVTATNSAGQVAYVDFTVVPTPVSSITLSYTSVQLKATETVKIEAQVAPADATDKSLTWTSSNTAVATVDANGNISAVSVGQADIKAAANDASGVAAICKVTVVPTPVESVSITANGSTTLKAGQTVQLNATVLPETATDKSVVWTSSNTAIATVDNAGLVTAVAVGNASITATAGDKSSSVNIVVEKTLAEAIALNRSTAAMKVTGTMQLSVVFTPETTTDKSVSWASSNPSIASVNENGLVTAHALGDCRITVTTKDGSNVSAYCDVTVGETAAESISIEPKGPFSFKVGETVQLTATVMPETATDKSVSWLSQSGAVSVDENGLVTAVALGTARVTATNSAGQVAYVDFTVVPTPVTSITLSSTSVQLKATETAKLEAQVAPADATDKSLTWTSSNTAVATVDANGNVTAIAVGEADIKAAANDASGVSAICKVTVVPTPVESVSITANGSTTLKAGQTVQLNATVLPETATDKTVAWTSANTAIATVDNNGLVTSVGVGNTTITATANGVSGTIDIIVLETPVESIELSCNKSTIKVGEYVDIFATVYPGTATNKTLTWAVGNSDILRIQDYDNHVLVVEAMQPGETLVTATSGNGVVGTLNIKVNPVLAESISINKSNVKLNVGETAQLIATILPDNATSKTVRWESPNPQTVTVDENGLLTAIAPGTTDIIAYTTDGSELSANCSIEVVQPVTSVSLSEHLLNLHPNETFTLVASIEPIDASDKSVAWGSSNENVAAVDASGVISTLDEGETIVAVTTLDGSNLSDECTVNVKKDENGGINSVSIDDIDITIEDSHIIIESLPNGVQARLYNLNGLMLHSVISNGEIVYIDVVPETIYILRVGNISLKVIVP